MTDMTISHYSTGTATVAAGGTTVTGQGTAWAGEVRQGDMFGTHKGSGVRIASVNSNTSLTLAYPWQGGAQTAAPYEIQRTPRDLGYRHAIEELIASVGEGNLPMFSALLAAANKLPYFDSGNSMALADFPAWARSLFGLEGAADRLPYLTGANGAALTTLTPFGRSILDDPDAPTALATLGLSSFWRERMGDDSALAAQEGLGVPRTYPHVNSLNVNDDFNNLTSPGWHNRLVTGNQPNGYSSNLDYGYLLVVGYTAAARLQIVFPYRDRDGPIYFRTLFTGTWSPWRTIWDTGNLSPTIITNSNGSYVRLPGGLQIAWNDAAGVVDVSSQQGPVFRGATELTWTPPAAFSGTPVSFASDRSSTNVWGSSSIGSTIATMRANLFCYTAVGNRSVSMLAIGRY